MGGVSLYLFGAPHITADGVSVQVSRRKALALLAYLAADERAHSRDTLAALLWPEWDTTSARTALRRVLVTAHKAAGPDALRVEQERISLPAETELWVDVRRFRSALAQSRAHRHSHLHTCADCLGWLREAAELCRDDFLAGFGLEDAPEFDDWQTFEAESLRRDAGEVLEKLAAIHAGTRDFAQAIDFARRWLALDPLHEPAHQMLIRLYAWAGDQAAALRQYRECAELLQRELGVSPQSETTELFEQVKAGKMTAQSLPVVAPPPAQPGPAPSTTTAEQLIRLPRLPDFIGRRAELVTLAALLADPNQRLVTVLGMGGMGKTSLAVVAAAQTAASFPDGVAFVPLAPLSHPSAIVLAIAEAIHYNFPPDNRPPLEQLVGYLSTRRLLLVLDNFEHLLEGAEIVAELLQGAPNLSLLVTSRERLNLRAETIFALEGMSWSDPDAEADAVRLFAQSARRVLTAYAPRPGEMESIVEICRLVGGMPLGIVMAAGWMEMLTPGEIAAEIRGSLDVLATELRDIPERQQSMRAVMAQTWERLNDAERDGLMRLSVFRGGFTREAAQAVTGTSLRTLLALSNRQLLQRTAAGRYDIHELLRQFAGERLAEAGLSEAAVEAHGTNFIQLLERSEAELKGADQQGALERLRAEQENVRTAWVWALGHRPADELVQAVESLALYYSFQRRFYEGIDLCKATKAKLQGVGEFIRLYIRMHIWHSVLCSPLGQIHTAKEFLHQSLEIIRSLEKTGQALPFDKAFALAELGVILWYEDIDATYQFLAESLAICRTQNDRWRMAKVLRESARILVVKGQYEEAETMALESLNIWTELGDRVNTGSPLSVLCWSTLAQNQPERAKMYAEQQVQLGMELRIQEIVMQGMGNLGTVYAYLGQYTKAKDVSEESMAMAVSFEHRHHCNTCRWRISKMATHLGEYEYADQLARTALREATAIGLRTDGAHALQTMGMVAAASLNYPEAQRALEESAKTYQDVGQSEFLSQVDCDLTSTYRRSGHTKEARDAFIRSLGWGIAYRNMETVTGCLPVAALLLADDGQPERAIELHALAWRYPRIANSRWFYDVAGKELETLAASLPPEVAAAAQERGKALDLLVTAQGLVERFGGEAVER